MRGDVVARQLGGEGRLGAVLADDALRRERDLLAVRGDAGDSGRGAPEPSERMRVELWRLMRFLSFVFGDPGLPPSPPVALASVLLGAPFA